MTQRKPLTETCESTLLQSISQRVQNIKSVFSCGGSVALGPKDQRLFFMSNEGFADFINFPVSDGDLEKLLKACKPATFGHGNKDVYDVNYRDALELSPGLFGTSF